MTRKLTPQGSGMPTPNDVKRAIASIDSIITVLEDLRSWKKQILDDPSKLFGDKDSGVGDLQTDLALVQNQMNGFDSHLKSFEKELSTKVSSLDKKLSDHLAKKPQKQEEVADLKKALTSLQNSVKTIEAKLAKLEDKE